MADPDAKASQASGGAGSNRVKAPKPPNPVWRMMGLPNFRFKLPSRNWSIFLTITGSWSAAVYYDRRQKKRIQRKWAKVVEYIAQETLDPKQMPRKLTMYIAAPPGDSIVQAREHFQEYVQPILVAAALDWDAVEGRREGDVRAGLAERIRRLRKRKGEDSTEPLEEDTQDVLAAARQRAEIREWDGLGGDIVIGRHTWKEYVRGLHEGWLGPLDSPVPTTAPVADTTKAPVENLGQASANDASPTAVEEPENPKEEEPKPKKKIQPPPFNTTADYNDSILSPHCPSIIGPSAVIPLPHLLGFLNFPIRMYRFLNRRQNADEIGRQTAAAVLGVYRPYDSPGESRFESGQSTSNVGDQDADGSSKWEQQRLLQSAEPEWHKSVRERKADDERERVWLDDMVLDSRIAERMQKFELDSGAEERANTIASEKEEAWWKSVWPKTEKKKSPWEGLSED
ncbi:mitochondrial import inner membrane translocase subunit tim54 [Pleomassaria siparia CBS 279.74]|uniref:Mitochondrial import inner membrane translocase subunit TIM54 n=1 Tax=Pleomassaria siparia CBS 279.74 TaxID=1314801 RepID=A0A6G1K109_9PLEO|nr:mitochondrial import inner membrane translocase subunit tim54 [Pleomassaria siparia CBS 279.74]